MGSYHVDKKYVNLKVCDTVELKSLLNNKYKT